MKTLFRILAGLVLALFIGHSVEAATGISALHATGTVLGLQVLRAFVSTIPGVAYDDVLTTFFTRDLQKILFPNNAFYRRSVTIGNGVDVAAATFEIPQELAEPTVVIDPTSFPLTVSEMVDASKNVGLSLIATMPTRLGDREALETAFDRRSSIVSRHNDTIDLRAAQIAINKWSQVDSAAIVRTTGDVKAASTTSATGTRKKLTKDDFIKANEILDRTELTGKRIALISASMYADLLGISDFVDYNKTSNTSALLTGSVGNILGIEIYKRGTAAIFTNDSTPVAKAAAAAGATTDNEAMLIWVESAVGVVLGTPKVYINEGQAQYLGTIYNNSVRFGATLMRNDKKGVVAVVQAAGA
jgi:hypothetical protein